MLFRSRREFLTRAAQAALVLSIAPSLLGGCDDSGDDTDGDSGTGDDDTGDDTGDDDTSEADACLDCADSAAEGESNSHGHIACVTQADLDGAADITVTSIEGDHTHTFTITAAQLQSIADGDTVTIDSTDSHPHSWDVALCA